MDDYIENILAENLTLKRKLESKNKAVVILNVELNNLKEERDSLKNRLENVKKKPGLISENLDVPYAAYSSHIMGSDQDGHCIESSRGAKGEVELLRQKLRDALGDVQVLRSKVVSNKVGVDLDKSALQKEEELVQQLEEMQRAKSQLEADLQVVLDEKEELVKERDAYKGKLHRLNHECNILLKGNSNGIIDLDALVTENRFLQERLQCAQEECLLAKQVSEKYKGMVQAKRHKAVGNNSNQDVSSGMLLSQKQVKELLDHCGRTEIPGSENGSAELRSLCAALLDSLGDKTLALSHQKRANRILAASIAELQARLEGLHVPPAFSPSAMLLDGYKHLEDEVRSPESSCSFEANDQFSRSEQHS